MKLCLILLSVAVVALALAAARLTSLLAVARGENRRLREIVTLNSKYGVTDLEELRRLRHDMRHYAITGSAVSASAQLSAPGSPAIRSLVEYYSAQARSAGASADLVLDLDICDDELVPDLCRGVTAQSGARLAQGKELLHRRIRDAGGGQLLHRRAAQSLRDVQVKQGTRALRHWPCHGVRRGAQL